jgi:ribose-phosphate pyrophosphokinase
MTMTWPEIPVLCAGSAGTHLATGLSDALGLEQVAVRSRRFPDSETCVTVEGDLGGRDVVVVQSTGPPQDANLQELYQLVEIAEGQGASSVTCVVPYLAYARQDRRVRPGEPVSVAVVVRCLAALGATALVVVDAHSGAAGKAVPGFPVTDVSSAPVFAEWVAELAEGLARPVLVAPDQGRAGFVADVAERAGVPSWALGKRKRDDGRTFYVVDERWAGLAGADAIVLDDLCSSGSTLLPVVAALREGGARVAGVGVTHLLTEPAVIEARLGDDVAFMATDTIAGPGRRLSVAEPLVDQLEAMLP